MAAQQRNRAPTQAAMLDGFAGIALDQHVNPPIAAIELHGPLPSIPCPGSIPKERSAVQPWPGGLIMAVRQGYVQLGIT
jgi:hypothetical protein